MIDKKVELTFGFSEVIAKATPEVVTATFNKMNPKPKGHTVPQCILEVRIILKFNKIN
jgi:hypothetical protein